jgi:DNA processing protein
MPTPEDVLIARAYLSRVAEPDNVAVWVLVAEVGPVEAADRIRAGAAGEDVTRATEARAHTADPVADLEAAERCGIRLVTPESPDWPGSAVAGLERTGARLLAGVRRGAGAAGTTAAEPLPPLALWVRGSMRLGELGGRSVAIVGSRAATEYGLHVALEFGYGLAERGVTIVSGGAYGIDAAAHRGALAAAGATVAVSAGGLDRPYPAGNARLFDRIAETGVLISESPPGASPHRGRFLTRNRLIAAFARGTVVVEAARRSGAANTARHTRRLGNAVMAVPGPITSTMSAGCHDLLRQDVDPAILVDSVEAVLGIVGVVGEGLGTSPTTVDDVRAVLDGFDPVVRCVFDGVPARFAGSAEDIAVRSGNRVGDVLRALPLLVAAGLVEESELGRFRVAA